MIREWLPVIFAAGVLAGCGGGGGGSSDTGTLKLSLTDAPVDHAEHVVVTFVGVELLDGSGNTLETITLANPRSVDLLEFQGRNSTFLLNRSRVPAGVYEEVRLLTATSNASCNSQTPPYDSYITVDGTDYPLIVPSGGSSGFKVKGPITIAAGGTGDYTIDFDLRKSIAQRGSTGCYNLKPVLRVVDNAQIGTLVGAIDGSMLADSSCTADPVTGAGAAVYVYQTADVLPDDVDGTAPEPLTAGYLHPRNDDSGLFDYEVGFLLTGDYTVALTCQAGDDDPTSDDPIAFLETTNATIAVDQDTVVDFPLPPPPP